MARIRTIKPAFWDDELVGTMPATTRLVFVGLFSLADDEGRLHGSAVKVRSQLFAYDDTTSTADVEAALVQLHNARRIRLYGNGQQRYVEVLNFRKHQRIDRPQRSQLPSPGPHYPSFPIEGADEQAIRDTLDGRSTSVRRRKRKGREEEEVSGSLRSPSPDDSVGQSVIEEKGPTAEQVRRVFDAWCRLFDRNANTKLDEKRRARIRWALREYDRRVVWEVLQGYASDPWRREASSRHELRVLLRDAAAIERGLELYGQRSAPAAGSGMDELAKAGY